jgi:hypothetical protein
MPKVGQTVEVLVVSNPFFLVSEHGSVFTTLVEPV